MRKKVGSVTASETNDIRLLFERSNGLKELAKILTADNSELYERLVMDIGTNSTAMQQWWNAMAEKYNWESDPNGNWEIDFSDGSIYLTTE